MWLTKQIIPWFLRIICFLSIINLANAAKSETTDSTTTISTDITEPCHHINVAIMNSFNTKLRDNYYETLARTQYIKAHDKVQLEECPVPGPHLFNDLITLIDRGKIKLDRIIFASYWSHNNVKIPTSAGTYNLSLNDDIGTKDEWIKDWKMNHMIPAFRRNKHSGSYTCYVSWKLPSDNTENKDGCKSSHVHGEIIGPTIQLRPIEINPGNNPIRNAYFRKGESLFLPCAYVQSAPASETQLIIKRKSFGEFANNENDNIDDYGDSHDAKSYSTQNYITLPYFASSSKNSSVTHLSVKIDSFPSVLAENGGALFYNLEPTDAGTYQCYTKNLILGKMRKSGKYNLRFVKDELDMRQLFNHASNTILSSPNLHIIHNGSKNVERFALKSNIRSPCFKNWILSENYSLNTVECYPPHENSENNLVKVTYYYSPQYKVGFLDSSIDTHHVLTNNDKIYTQYACDFILNKTKILSNDLGLPLWQNIPKTNEFSNAIVWYKDGEIIDHKNKLAKMQNDIKKREHANLISYIFTSRFLVDKSKPPLVIQCLFQSEYGFASHIFSDFSANQTSTTTNTLTKNPFIIGKNHKRSRLITEDKNQLPHFNKVITDKTTKTFIQTNDETTTPLYTTMSYSLNRVEESLKSSQTLGDQHPLHALDQEVPINIIGPTDATITVGHPFTLECSTIDPFSSQMNASIFQAPASAMLLPSPVTFTWFKDGRNILYNFQAWQSGRIEIKDIERVKKDANVKNDENDILSSFAGSLEMDPKVIEKNNHKLESSQGKQNNPQHYLLRSRLMVQGATESDTGKYTCVVSENPVFLAASSDLLTSPSQAIKSLTASARINVVDLPFFTTHSSTAGTTTSHLSYTTKMEPQPFPTANKSVTHIEKRQGKELTMDINSNIHTTPIGIVDPFNLHFGTGQQTVNNKIEQDLMIDNIQFVTHSTDFYDEETSDINPSLGPIIAGNTQFNYTNSMALSSMFYQTSLTPFLRPQTVIHNAFEPTNSYAQNASQSEISTTMYVHGKVEVSKDANIMIPPSKPSIVQESNNSVLVKWNVPDNPSSSLSSVPVWFFKVQYRQLYGFDREWKTQDGQIPADQRYVRVGELNPVGIYKFRIAAVYTNYDNRHGVAAKYRMKPLSFSFNGVTPDQNIPIENSLFSKESKEDLDDNVSPYSAVESNLEFSKPHPPIILDVKPINKTAFYVHAMFSDTRLNLTQLRLMETQCATNDNSQSLTYDKSHKENSINNKRFLPVTYKYNSTRQENPLPSSTLTKIGFRIYFRPAGSVIAYHKTQPFDLFAASLIISPNDNNIYVAKNDSSRSLDHIVHFENIVSLLKHEIFFPPTNPKEKLNVNTTLDWIFPAEVSRFEVRISTLLLSLQNAHSLMPNLTCGITFSDLLTLLDRSNVSSLLQKRNSNLVGGGDTINSPRYKRSSLQSHVVFKRELAYLQTPLEIDMLESSLSNPKYVDMKKLPLSTNGVMSPEHIAQHSHLANPPPMDFILDKTRINEPNPYNFHYTHMDAKQGQGPYIISQHPIINPSVMSQGKTSRRLFFIVVGITLACLSIILFATSLACYKNRRAKLKAYKRDKERNKVAALTAFGGHPENLQYFNENHTNNFSSMENGGKDVTATLLYDKAAQNMGDDVHRSLLMLDPISNNNFKNNDLGYGKKSLWHKIFHKGKSRKSMVKNGPSQTYNDASPLQFLNVLKNGYNLSTANINNYQTSHTTPNGTTNMTSEALNKDPAFHNDIVDCDAGLIDPNSDNQVFSQTTTFMTHETNNKINSNFILMPSSMQNENSNSNNNGTPSFASNSIYNKPINMNGNVNNRNNWAKSSKMMIDDISSPATQYTTVLFDRGSPKLSSFRSAAYNHGIGTNSYATLGPTTPGGRRKRITIKRRNSLFLRIPNENGISAQNNVNHSPTYHADQCNDEMLSNTEPVNLCSTFKPSNNVALNKSHLNLSNDGARKSNIVQENYYIMPTNHHISTLPRILSSANKHSHHTNLNELNGSRGRKLSVPSSENEFRNKPTPSSQQAFDWMNGNSDHTVYGARKIQESNPIYAAARNGLGVLALTTLEESPTHQKNEYSTIDNDVGKTFNTDQNLLLHQASPANQIENQRTEQSCNKIRNTSLLVKKHSLSPRSSLNPSITFPKNEYYDTFLGNDGYFKPNTNNNQYTSRQNSFTHQYNSPSVKTDSFHGGDYQINDLEEPMNLNTFKPSGKNNAYSNYNGFNFSNSTTEEGVFSSPIYTPLSPLTKFVQSNPKLDHTRLNKESQGIKISPHLFQNANTPYGPLNSKMNQFINPLEDDPIMLENESEMPLSLSTFQNPRNVNTKFNSSAWMNDSDAMRLNENYMAALVAENLGDIDIEIPSILPSPPKISFASNQNLNNISFNNQDTAAFEESLYHLLMSSSPQNAKENGYSDNNHNPENDNKFYNDRDNYQTPLYLSTFK